MNASQDSTINIDDLIKTMEAEKPAKSGLIITDDDDIATPKKQSPVREVDITEPEKEYTGLGAVVTKEEMDRSREQVNSKGINIGSKKEQDASEGAKKWLKDADAQIEAIKKEHGDKIIEAEVEAQKAKLAGQSVQNVVNIYLDKAQVGEIAFTPEQQKRIEFADKIVLNETTEVKYSSIKILRKNMDKDDTNGKKKRMSIIKKAFDRTLSPFVALSSGYMGKMGNCSTADIMKLGRNIDSGRNLTSELERWSLLYEKMQYCSLGKFDTFDDFLKNTAYDDYDNLQFALICASFPESTSIEFTCPQCNSKFSVDIKNKELLRTEDIDENMANYVKDIFSADTFIERAVEVHEHAPFNVVSRISVNGDDPSVLLDLYAPSAYDAIHRTYDMLDSKYRDNDEMAAYVELLKMIKAGYIIDDESSVEGEEPAYIEFDDPDEIVEIISQFNESQLEKIAIYINQSYLMHKYSYGIADVTCNKCKHNLGNYNMSMDRLLFLKLRR